MRDFQDLLGRLIDVAMIALGATVASQIRFESAAEGNLYMAFVAFSAAFSLALAPCLDIRGRGVLGIASQVSIGWLVVQGCALGLMFSLHHLDSVSRLWFAYWTAMSGGLMIAWRLVLHATIACLHDVGLKLKQVAIVGSDGNCNSIIEKINRAKHSGYRASAVLNIVPDSSFRDTSVTVFQDQDAFIDHVRSRGIREVWLALPLSQEHTILRIVNALRDDLVNLRFIPDVRSVALFEGGVSRLLGEAAINLSVSPPSRSACVKKEIFDRGFALAALVAITPLLIGIAIAIKVSSPGPVLFKQRRKGVDGRIFTIYKFRSMHVHTAPAGVLHQATRNDPRVTRVGAILRRTSLDELPQFFNVLRGDMSVVGPRPHALEHDYIYEKVVPGYVHRYRVKPGLTGWAQVNGFRGETDKIEKMEGRVAFDLYYVTNWSFALDMRIIFGTIINGLRDVNAY